MPSTYAHRIYGKRVREGLSGRTAELIDQNRQLYDIGLHGPDILFYHKPLLYNKVNRIGHNMHREKGSRFFTDVKPMIFNSENPEGALAYILGFICHFALDSTCHPYVAQAMLETKVPHVELETEFDKFLMRKDGLDPWEFHSGSHLVSSEENARVIAPLLGISAKDAYIAVKDMKFYAKFLTTTNPVLRNVIFFFLKILGLSENIRGMFLNKETHPSCMQSSERLLELFEEAVPIGCALIENYMEFYQRGTPLIKRFELKYE